jgi:hypothetical protein
MVWSPEFRRFNSDSSPWRFKSLYDKVNAQVHTFPPPGPCKRPARGRDKQIKPQGLYMSLEGRRLTLNDSITMIKEWINGALRPLGVRVTGPGPQTFEVDDGWPEERRYWEGQIRTYYQAQFGLGLHPLQTDSAIVPPVKLATTIQGANKADPDGFFASGYRTILGYLAELRDYGVSPTDMGAHPRNGCGAWAAHGASVPLPGRTAWLRRDGACAGMDSFKTRPTHRIALDQPRTFIALSGRALRLVYANSVLTHIPCAMMSQWAAELRRVVRPGGMVIVSVLDPNHYLRHSRTENTIQHTIVRGATAGTWRRGY